MNFFGHHHHHNDDPMREAPAWAIELYYMALAIIERTDQMATQEQVDKIKTDVEALLAAVAAIPAPPPPPAADPALDDLDARIVAATNALKPA